MLLHDADAPTLEATAPDPLQAAILRARDALLRRQRDDGHWVFELEADATIPAEYVLLEHYLDRIDPELQGRIGIYLRSTQAAHGGWPLFHDGAFNISASVKAYFALKAIGDDPDAPHMRAARDAILAAGGAARTNVFTRAQLALFGEAPWRAVPVMPLEIMLLPRWFPFTLDRVSYWSRTVIVPLLVLMARRPARAIRAGSTLPNCSPRRPGRCATGSAARTAPPGAGRSAIWTARCGPRRRCSRAGCAPAPNAQRWPSSPSG